MAKKRHIGLGKPFCTTDEGGNAYLMGGKVIQTTIGSELTMRCLDCRKLNIVLRRQLDRIARPRCIQCGGPLEEVEASRRRRLGGRTAEQELAKPTTSCRACSKKFTDPWALGLHLVSKAACMDYYQSENLGIDIEETTIVFDTIFVTREARQRKCILRGYSTGGELLNIQEFPSLRVCQELLATVFGSDFKIHVAPV